MRILKKWWKENSGLTLVELICAVAIFSLVGATICSVMIVSAQNYQKDTNEIELQQEAQLTANQLQDMLIDADQVDFVSLGMLSKLTVIKGGTIEYTVTHLSSTCELRYKEVNLTTGALVASNQLIAENVTTFSVDTTNYASTRNLTLSLGLAKDGRSYESSYTVSSRNQVPSVSSGVPDTVTLATQDTLVYEPNEDHPLNATLDGTSDKAVSWSMTGNTSGDTKVYPAGNSWRIHIGSDEQSSELHLTVKSNVKQADGVTPAAEQYVTVYVRRVMAIAFDASAPILQSGIAKQAGAIYRLDVAVTGNHLDQYGLSVTDTDMNYVDPRQVEWVLIPTLNGTAVANPNEYVEKIEENDGYIRIRLKKTLESGVELTVKAIAKHPKGTNKMLIPYGDVSIIYKFYQNYYTFNGGLLYRGTDVAQGSIDVSTLKTMVKNKHSIETDQVGREYRFREVYSENEITHERTCGPWSGWTTMTAEEGNALNLRPSETYRFEFNKDYEIQIRFFMYNSDRSEIKWPFAGDPPEINLIDAEIKRIKLYFTSSQLGFAKANTCGTKDAPVPVVCNTNVDLKIFEQDAVDMGYNLEKDQNCLMFKVEKLSGNTWIAAESSDFSLDVQGFRSASHVKFNNAGTYRVIFGLKQVPYREYDEATKTGTDIKIDYWLGNEATGDCIFYIKAQ